MTHELHILLRGGLFLGGELADGRRQTTLRDAKGLPFIPASALKGAIRTQLERLGADDLLPFFGTTGRDPRSDATQVDVPEPPGGGTARLFFTDARPIDELGARPGLYLDRPHVAIDRDTGTVAGPRFFEREILASRGADPANAHRFVAQVNAAAMTAAQVGRLGRVISAVLALGAGKSSGLGWVEIRLTAISESKEETSKSQPRRRSKSPKSPTLPSTSTVDLWLLAEDPICLGTERQLGNFFPTRQFLPAKTLRGAVVTAALRRRGITVDQSHDPAFRARVLDPETCLRFSDAWPVDPNDLPSSGNGSSRNGGNGAESRVGSSFPCPAPATLWQCKAQPEKHPEVDHLLVEIYRRRLLDLGIHYPHLHQCPTCKGRQSRVGGILGGRSPERRFVTRLRMNLATGRGEDGKLFAIELLERGNLFRTRVSRLDDAGRQFLEDAFADSLRVGHGRGQGYGRMRLVRAEPVQDASLPGVSLPDVAQPVISNEGDDLATRLEKFDRQVRQGLQALSVDFGCDPEALGAHKHYIAVTLLADTIIPAEPGSLLEALEKALGLGGSGLEKAPISWAFAALRFAQQGGWNALTHRPEDLDSALAAGSVATFSTERPLEKLLPRLRNLESRGAGLRTEQGFGGLRFSDPIHLQDFAMLEEGIE